MMLKKLGSFLLSGFLFANTLAFGAADDIARLYNFTPGTPIRSSEINAEFNQLVNTMNNKFGRGVTNTLTGNNTFTGTSTFNGASTFGAGSTFNVLSVFNAGIDIERSSDITSPADGTLWYNTTTDILKAQVNGSTVNILTSASTNALPGGYRATSSPVYASANTFTVAKINDKSSDGTGDIVKATSTTVDLSTTGLNGIAQSANLTGTATFTASSSTVSGSGTNFNTDFVVGDTIRSSAGQCRRITAIGSGTSLTVNSNFSSTETGVTFKRGCEAADTWYNLYTISNGVTPGTLLSNRNVAGGQALVDLPSGYTLSRQQAFAVRNDNSSAIIPFTVGNGWPLKPFIQFATSHTYHNGTSWVNGATQIYAAAPTSTYTALSNLPNFVPPISRSAKIKANQVSANSVFAIRNDGSTSEEYVFAFGITGTSTTNGRTETIDILTSATQGASIRLYVGAPTVYLDVVGFVVTELAD